MRKLTGSLVFLLLWPVVAGAGPAGDLVDDLLDELTLAEKVGQLFLVYHSPPWFLAEHGFGGSLVMETMLMDYTALADSLALAAVICRVPPLVAIDQEGGHINRLRPMPGWATVPSAVEMGTWSTDSITTYVTNMARQLTALGINLNLAPVLDPSYDPAGQATWMLHRQRTYGLGAENIVRTAGAFMAGCAAAGVACVTKHFPGYNVMANSDLAVATSSAAAETVWQTAVPFDRLAARAAGVMMSSIRFTEISQVPAVFDPAMVARARDGQPNLLVITDDLWATSLRAWISGTDTVDPVAYPPEHLCRLVLMAFAAGNDLLMVTFPAKAVEMKAVLVTEIRDNPQWVEKLDRSVARILRVKADLGLLAP